MNKTLLISCLLFFTINAFGQQFSQYNTGTVYDSFENPSQRSFIPDTSRQFAFNFFLPTFNANAYIGGNGQTAIKTHIFDDYYNTGNLQVGKGRYNFLAGNASGYSIMLKMYSSFRGDQEIGFFVKTKIEGRGAFTDESAAIFNGPKLFPDSIYNNVFNDNYFYQAYHQIGFTFRQQISNKLAFGIKLSALSGIHYNKVQINSSRIVFDKQNDEATVALQGISYESKEDEGTTLDQMGLAFKNPGVAISAGVTYTTEDGYKFQYNIKDLGFIHWNKNSAVKVFEVDTIKITGLSTPARENNITNSFNDATHSLFTRQAFNSPTNGLAEVSVNKTYNIDYDRMFTVSPTLILSKELFYSGFTAALVAPVNYKSVTLSFISSYNDMKMLNIGGQFLLKKDNSEFFIGSERLIKTLLLGKTIIKSSTGPQTQDAAIQSNFTGMDFFIGCSFKFGQLIEHRMNSSHIPMDDKNFFGRLYDRLFKPKD